MEFKKKSQSTNQELQTSLMETEACFQNQQVPFSEQILLHWLHEKTKQKTNITAVLTKNSFVHFQDIFYFIKGTFLVEDHLLSGDHLRSGVIIL